MNSVDVNGACVVGLLIGPLAVALLEAVSGACYLLPCPGIRLGIGWLTAMNREIACPFCGEGTELDLGGDVERGDPDEHVFVQDCEVCCAPITVRVRIGVDGDFEVSYDRE
jgi:hypothetical protein